MTKLRIIVEVQDVDPTLVDPVEVAEEMTGLGWENAEVLDAEWVEDWRVGDGPANPLARPDFPSAQHKLASDVLDG